MKKVLFATTALVLSAGVAAAEVALSGDGRMGIVFDGDDAQFSSRARVRFTLTGESDSGLSFGATFRVDHENYTEDYLETGNYRSAAKGTAGEVWISGTYGKLSMGDTLSASEAAIGDLYEIGYTDGRFGNDIEEINYLTGDGVNTNQGPNILYEYSINQFSFYASASDGVDTDLGDLSPGANNDDDADLPSDKTAYSLAAKYAGETWWAALGYAKHDEADELSLGAEGTFGQFKVKGVYLDYSDHFLSKTYGLAAAYNMDAFTVEAFWRQDELTDVVVGGRDGRKYDAYGIGVDYDLGGGAVVSAGIIDNDYLDDFKGDTVADLGIKFTF